jgi:hypothetical protein
MPTGSFTADITAIRAAVWPQTAPQTAKRADDIVDLPGA